MNFQTQKVPGNLGNTQWSISSYGCKTTCYAMILGVDVHEIAKHAEYYDSDGLLVDDSKVASDFGGQWDARRDVALHDPVVVETKYTYSSGKQSQHFLVRYQGKLYDPLTSDGHCLQDYKIISYRNMWKEGNNMTYDLFGTPDGTVYERLNNYALVHIPNPEFAVRYYGANWHDKVKIVDDIWSVGWIAEDPRPLKNRISELENRPPEIKTVTQVVKEIVKETVEVDKLTDEERKQVESEITNRIKTAAIEEYQKAHKLTNEQETVLSTWEKIKEIFNKLSDVLTGRKGK